MGAAANGIVKVRNAVEMLQQALPTIPMGTELWTAVHKACVDIGKHLRPEDRDQGAQVGGLLQQIRQTAQAGPQNAVARLTPQGPQPPVMPPPAGAGAP